MVIIIPEVIPNKRNRIQGVLVPPGTTLIGQYKKGEGCKRDTLFSKNRNSDGVLLPGANSIAFKGRRERELKANREKA